MHVDEKGEHQLTNYYGKNYNGKVTQTDHAKIELNINLKFEVNKPQRIEAYNLKNPESQKFFRELTTNTDKLNSCFQSDEPFQKQMKMCEHKLKSHVIKSFPKIHSRKRKFCDTEIGQLLEERKNLRLNEKTIENFETKISDIESVIANKISEKYMIEISDTMGHMTGDDGAIVHSGVWKAKTVFLKARKITSLLH